MIKDLLGNSFVDKAGETYDASCLDGKHVGIYFSAHWCPPCRGFTPKLAESYGKMTKNGKPFEIVFLSSDQDQDAFDEYLADMPWKAVPYKDRELKKKLGDKFEVQGIPTLVIVDEDGNLITKSGRAKVSNDPEGNSFPWKPPTVFEAMGNSFLGKDGAVITRAEATKGKTVGLYFSAHWCPPCRGFTPKLADTYKKVVADGKPFEVIFVSCDSSEDEFKEYFADMPWLAVAYDNDKVKDALSELFEVSGIPALVILDGDTGNVLNANGRSAISDDAEGKNFPWKRA